MGLFSREPDVKKLKEKRDIKGLLKALEYEKSKTVQGYAARALGEIKDPEAVEPLIMKLKAEDKDTDTRYCAASALGMIEDARAVEPLIDALQDKYPVLRAEAANALGMIKDARAVEALIDSLKLDEKSIVWDKAAWALGRMKDERAVGALIWAMTSTRPVPSLYTRGGPGEALASIGSLAVEPLIEAMADDDPINRSRIVNVLTSIGEVAIEPLTKALDDENSLIRETAKKALDRIRGKK